MGCSCIFALNQPIDITISGKLHHLTSRGPTGISDSQELVLIRLACLARVEDRSAYRQLEEWPRAPVGIWSPCFLWTSPPHYYNLNGVLIWFNMYKHCINMMLDVRCSYVFTHTDAYQYQWTILKYDNPCAHTYSWYTYIIMYIYILYVYLHTYLSRYVLYIYMNIKNKVIWSMYWIVLVRYEVLILAINP